MVLFFPVVLTGADKKKPGSEKFWWGFQINNTLSYTGFSNALLGVVSKNDFQLYAGPRLLTSDAYLPTEGPWGINSGVSWFFTRGEKMHAKANLDYQVVFLEPYNPHNLPEKGRNATHEFNISYGFTYFFLQNFGVGNSIGFGRYLERFHDLQENVTRTYSGYSGLIRVHLHYSF